MSRLMMVDVLNDQDYGLPIGEVLGGAFVVPALPQGWTALDGIVLVKCFDQNGRTAWAFRESESINEEEVIGALTMQLEFLKERVWDQFSVDGQDDEDDD